MIPANGEKARFLDRGTFALQCHNDGSKVAYKSVQVRPLPGTANISAAELRRCEYGLQLVENCKLDWHNFFTPGGWWPKAVDRKWS